MVREAPCKFAQRLAVLMNLGWNPTQRWFTQVYAGWAHPAGEAANFDAWSWQNQFQLIAGDSSPIALGAFFEIERPRDRTEGYAVTWGPMLQFESANLQTNLNLLFSRYVRTQEAQTTTLSYQWQVKQLWRLLASRSDRTPSSSSDSLASGFPHRV